MKCDETRRFYFLIRVLGITVLALFILVNIAGAAPFAYITNQNDNTVSVIDIAKNTVVNTVPVGMFPYGIAVSSDGANVYVANVDSNSISVINTVTNKVSTVNVGKLPEGVTITPDGNKVYVSNKDSNSVSIIDTSTNTVTATVPVGTSPIGVAVSPDGNNVYVANEGSNSVSVINIKTNKVTFVKVGYFPYQVAVTSDGTKAYVTNEGDGTVSVINTKTNKVTSVNVETYPSGIAVSPDGTNVYVANDGTGTVSVINTKTNKVTATVKEGLTPVMGFGLGPVMGIAVSPDGAKVYVVNFYTGNDPGNVYVINTTTNKVIDTVKVGRGPVALGHFIGHDLTITAKNLNFLESGKTKWATAPKLGYYLISPVGLDVNSKYINQINIYSKNEKNVVGQGVEVSDLGGNYPGQCVSFAKALSNSKIATTYWRTGAHVVDTVNLAPGTVIATFDGKNNYDNTKPSGNEHTAIFCDYIRSNGRVTGIKVWDQNFVQTIKTSKDGKTILIHGAVGKHDLIRNNPKGGVNDANNYYVVDTWN